MGLDPSKSGRDKIRKASSFLPPPLLLLLLLRLFPLVRVPDRVLKVPGEASRVGVLERGETVVVPDAGGTSKVE